MKPTYIRHQELTSKRLKEVTSDGNEPSLLKFLLFESVEWLVLALLAWIFIAFTRPLWSPVFEFIGAVVNYLF